MSETIFNPSDFNSDAANYPTHELNEDTEQTIATGGQTGATSDKTADPQIREHSSVKNAGGDGNIHSDNFGSAQNQFKTTADSPFLELPFGTEEVVVEDLESLELEDIANRDDDEIAAKGAGEFSRKQNAGGGTDGGAGDGSGGDGSKNPQGIDLNVAKEAVNSGVEDSFGEKSGEVLNILNQHGISEEKLANLIGKEFTVNGTSFQIESFADAMNYLNATEGMNFTLLTVDILNATGIDIQSVGISNVNAFGMDREDIMASLMGEVQALFGPSFTVNDLQAILNEMDMSVDQLVEIMGKPLSLNGTEGPVVETMNGALLAMLEGREQKLAEFYARIEDAIGVDLTQANLSPDQIEVVNFLKVLASILAFLVVVKNEIMQLDSELISKMNQAKLDLNEIKTSISEQNVIKSLTTAKEDYQTFVENKQKEAEQKACQTALKIIMPIVTVLVAVVAIVGAIFTGGASLALVVVMVALTVLLCSISLVDQLMEGGLYNKIFDALGVAEDPILRAVLQATIELILTVVVTILTLGATAAVLATSIARIAANSTAQAIQLTLKLTMVGLGQLIKQLGISLGTRLGALLIVDVVSQFFIASNLAAELIGALIQVFAGLGGDEIDEETMMWIKMGINIALSVLTIGVSLGVAFGGGSKAVKAVADASEEVGTGLGKQVLNSADEGLEVAGDAADITRRSADFLEEGAESTTDAAKYADDIAEGSLEASDDIAKQGDEVAEGIGEGLGTAAKSGTGLAGAGADAATAVGRASREGAETAMDQIMEGIQGAQETMKKILTKIIETLEKAIASIKGMASSFKHSKVGGAMVDAAEFMFKKVIPGILGFEGGEHISRKLPDYIRKPLEVTVKLSNFLHETAVRFNAIVQISVAAHQLKMIDLQAENVREQAAWQYIVDTFNSFDDWFSDLISTLRDDMAEHIKAISDFAKVIENFVATESKANDALFNAIKT